MREGFVVITRPSFSLLTNFNQYSPSLAYRGYICTIKLPYMVIS